MTLVAWSKISKEKSLNLCKTIGITFLVLGFILIQSLIAGFMYTTYTTLEANNSQLKKNVTSLTGQNSALETKLFDLTSQFYQLKAKVKSNTFDFVATDLGRLMCNSHFVTQCGILIIFLSHRIYVKLILRILEVQNLRFGHI